MLRARLAATEAVARAELRRVRPAWEIFHFAGLTTSAKFGKIRQR